MKTTQNLLSFKNWQEIPWKSINIKVRNLQEQIIKAKLDKNMSLVYKLQRQLVTCVEARALAIRKVVTNSGGKTAGIDHIKWETPASRFEAIYELGQITKNPKKYKASPLKRVMIPKAYSDEMRPLGIPTLIDRAVQAVYHLAVDPIVELTSDKNSYGFRTGRSQHDAIAYLRSWLDKGYSPQWILEADIAKCFDRIDHEILMKLTPICDKTVLKQWLKAGYIYEGQLHPTTAGTPQGGIISPMLCNVALNGLEALIRERYPVNKSVKGGKPKCYICRYADDIVVTGTSIENLTAVKEMISEFLKIRGLELKETKTRIVHIEEGFDFLGFNISRKGYNPRLNHQTDQKTVLIIKPSEKAIKSYKTKLKEIILNRNDIKALVHELNPLIRGWANYFKISYHSQATFIKMGHYLWILMMKWVSRKHPKGSLRLNIKKYIVEGKTRSRHKWVWGVKDRHPDPLKENKLTIINMAEISPKIHVLLKLDKNPYLLEDQSYFDKRKVVKIEAKFRESIYKKYSHICPLCGVSLHNGENVELHHIIPVREGGKYSLTNIQPLHQTCHQSITHSNKTAQELSNPSTQEIKTN